MARETTQQRKRDAARSKAAILSAAIAEFAERGPAGTRMDDIGTRAGVNKSLIYQYFGSKSELYAIALNSVLMKVTEKAAVFSKAFADDAPTGSVRDYIRRYLGNHLALMEEVPEYPRMMAWENLEGGRTLARLPLQATYQSFLGRVKQIIAPLQEKGMLREGFSVAYVAQAVMALTHYFVIQRGTIKHLFLIDPYATETRETWLDFCADMFLASFANAQ